jgi:hypothetical protein
MVCTFAPLNTKNWVLKIPCYYHHEGNSDIPHRETFTVFGKGNIGSIKASPQKVDFGVILVNTNADRDIVISNPSECDLYFAVEIVMEKSHSVTPSSTRSEANLDLLKAEKGNFYRLISGNELQISLMKKLLPAHSNQTLKLTACVKEQREYKFTVFYRLMSMFQLF